MATPFLRTIRQTPGHCKRWPPVDSDLMDSIWNAIQWCPLSRARPVFDFLMSTVAADKNFALLKDNDFDLERILLSDGLALLLPGSEFHPVSLLQPIFEAHPFWQRMQSSLLVGATIELTPLPEMDQTTLIDTALAYGNHKSATSRSHTTSSSSHP